MSSAEVLEQVPVYKVKTLDDGVEEKLQIVINLPGITSASEFEVNVGSSHLHLHSPGRYNLDLPLGAIVEIDQLKYVRKHSELKATLVIKERLMPAPAQSESRPSPSAAAAGAAKLALDESFLAEAVKLRDSQRKSRPQSSTTSSRPPKRDPAEELGVKSMVDEPPSGWERPKRRSRPRPAHAPKTPDLVDEVSKKASNSAQAASAVPDSYNDAQTRAEGASPKAHQEEAEVPNGNTSHAPAEAAGPSQSEEGLAAGGAASAESPHVYEAAEAMHQSRRESAQEAFAQANAALEVLDLPKALRMLRKAASLEPGKYERLVKILQGMIQQQTWTKEKQAYTGLSERQWAEALDEFQKENLGRGDRHNRPQSGQRSPHSNTGGAGGEQQQPASASQEGDSPSSSPREQPGPNGKAKQQEKRQPKNGKHREQAERGREQAKGRPEAGASAEAGPSYRTEPAREATAEKSDLGEGVRLWIMPFIWLLMEIALFCLRRIKHYTPQLFTRAALYFNQHQLYSWLTRSYKGSLAFRLVYIALSWVAMLGTIWLACSFVALGVHFSVSTGWSTVTMMWNFWWWLLRVTFWRPRFWSSAVLSTFIFFGPAFKDATLVRLITFFWAFPLTWWALGGRWWALLSVPLSVLSCVWTGDPTWMMGALSLMANAVWWTGWLWGGICCVLIAAGYVLLTVALQQHMMAEKSTSAEIEVPEGAEGEVRRVLEAQDFYKVLDISKDADAEILKKAKREKSLATHPDKLKQAIGSNEAFARVTEAHKVLSDTKLRARYDQDLAMKAMARDYMHGQGFQSNAEPSQSKTSWAPQQSSDEFSWPCENCGRYHTVSVVDRPLDKARYCSGCKEFHPCKEGDSWMESAGFFASDKMYVCAYDSIYDVTEWARCSGRMRAFKAQGVGVDEHDVRASFGATVGEECSHGPRKKGKKGRKQR